MISASFSCCAAPVISLSTSTPSLVVARRHELFRDEVHAVVQRADDAEVGELKERDEPASLSALLR